MMIIEAASPNLDERPGGVPIDMLVMHYTGMETAAAALARLCDPGSKVSAHYLIDEDGAVYRLVQERMRAWHAGVSAWRGWTDINDRSIGIELVNPGHAFGYRAFPDAQMAAAVDLSREIVARHGIPSRNVVGHSDVAPGRKMDPGELFNWTQLAAAGVGLWPKDSEIGIMDPNVIADMLAKVGYEMSDPLAALKAFQRHFRPERVTGRIDFGTARRLAGLLEACTGV
jgi:N-acetylmuramoyl-L-alanine amidase